MLGRIFVEDGIGVVDVDENFSGRGIGGELGQEAVGSGKREVAHFACGFLAAAGAEEFVVGPESAVEEGDGAGGGGFEPFAGNFGERRSEEKRLAGLLEAESDDGLLGRERATEFAADVVGEAAAYRDGRTNERRRSGGVFPETAGQTSAGRKTLPVDGRIGAVEHVEDAIFGLYDFLDGRRGEEEEGLEFAKMEEAHEGVDIGGREENASDGSAGGFVIRRGKLRRGQDLAAEVGGSAEKEPDGAVGREGQLSLSAGLGLDGPRAKAGTVVAGAVPLREASAGCGAEDFNVHGRVSCRE